MKTYYIDFEFSHEIGQSPRPLCVAWHCVDTGEEGSRWLDDAETPNPFPSEFRMIAHYALAELGCFHALGWPLPTAVIDTLPEARTSRGQCLLPGGSWGLLSLARSYGIHTMTSEHKEEMRLLAMDGNVAPHRREELMDYCLGDVRAGLALWRKMEAHVHLAEAEMRGRYLKALTLVEAWGIPVDVDLISRLQKRMPEVLEAAWKQARMDYPGVIDAHGSFSSKAWLRWCARSGIPWPRLSSGAPALDADTFKKLADRYPAVRTMAYSRKLRGQGRKFEFPLGANGRLRCMLSPFASDTGRNQPSNKHFIFGASAWMRSVIAAPKGKVLAYVDYSSQEVGLAADLSGDEGLLDDYRSGDPYIAFAIRAGAAPEGATKQSHPSERATYKVAMLSLQYGIGDEALAQNLGIPVPTARRLISSHKEAYPNFWRWREAVVDEVMSGGTLFTRYGWGRQMKPKDSANSIANFQVQAAGGEILRAAVIALVEAGHRVIAPVHDALLVEIDADGWQGELAKIQDLMSKAAEVVTGGLWVPTDVELVFHGENYVDDRGAEFWKIAAPVLGRGPLRLPKAERKALLESQICLIPFSYYSLLMKGRGEKNGTSKASHPSAKSPSLAVEREAIRQFGDRRSRAILAVFHARRCAQQTEFFVSPQIARLNRLSPTDLNWALDKLEGEVVETLEKKNGKWRVLRLLPEFEQAETAPSRAPHPGLDATADLQPDEERVVYDQEHGIRQAASLDGEMPPEVLDVLNEIASKSDHE